MRRGQRLRGKQDQQRVREIAETKDSDCEKESSKRWRQLANTRPKRARGGQVVRPLADQQAKRQRGQNAGHQSPRQNPMIVVRSQMKQPQGRNRSEDGAQRVHHSLETEGAPVGIRRDPGGQQSLSPGSSDTTPEPGAGAREQNVPCASRQRQRTCGEGRENVAALHKRLSVL